MRPSVLLGLMKSRRANQDARTHAEGGMRLFEIASSFAQKPDSRETVERRQLALLMDIEHAGKNPKHDDVQRAVRLMRGVVDALADTVCGHGARVVVTPGTPAHTGYDGSAFGTLAVEHGGSTKGIGCFGLLSDAAKRAEDLDGAYVAAELWIDDLVAMYPPIGSAELLPAYPGIDRDLSLIVDDSVRWAQVDELVASTQLERCVGRDFVGVFRGEQIGAGKKSLTMRLHFRDDERTMTHEEVDPQMAQVASAAKEALGAEIRA